MLSILHLVLLGKVGMPAALWQPPAGPGSVQHQGHDATAKEFHGQVDLKYMVAKFMVELRNCRIIPYS